MYKDHMDKRMAFHPASEQQRETIARSRRYSTKLHAVLIIAAANFSILKYIYRYLYSTNTTTYRVYKP